MKTLQPLIPVLLLVAAAAAPAQEPATPAADINPAILEVNGDTIYAADISMVIRNIVSQLQAQNREVPPEQELVQMATQRVVEQTLLAQEATRRGYRADDLRVAEMMREVEQQAGGREQLEQALTAAGTSREALRDTLVEMDLTRTLIATDISPTVDVSDESVIEFYEQNQQLFDAPERIRARHIVIAVAEDADEAAAAAARARAEDARRRALAGEDFAELARELSDGPTAPRGGELGVFSEDQLLPELAGAAFALQPGDISEVVRSEHGFHVIKVEERLPAGLMPLEEVKPRVRSLLAQQEIGGKVQELIQTLGEAADIRPLVTGPPSAAGAGAAPPG